MGQYSTCSHKNDTPTRSLTWKPGNAKTNSRDHHDTRRLAKCLIHTSGPSTVWPWHPQPRFTGLQQQIAKDAGSSGSRTRCGILAFSACVGIDNTCPGLPMSREIPVDYQAALSAILMPPSTAEAMVFIIRLWSTAMQRTEESTV